MDIHTLLESWKILILIDWECLLCHGFARFVISQDSKQECWFGALQDEKLIGELAKKGIEVDAQRLESVQVVKKHLIYDKSRAVLEALSSLPRYRWWTSLWMILPSSRSDWLYDLVAKNRIWRFGKRENCDLATSRLLHERRVRV